MSSVVTRGLRRSSGVHALADGKVAIIITGVAPASGGGGGCGSGGNVFGMVIRGPNYPTPESGNSSWGAALKTADDFEEFSSPAASYPLPFPPQCRFRPATGNPFWFGKKKGVGRGAQGN